MNNKNFISSQLNLLILVIRDDHGENLLISHFGSVVTYWLLMPPKRKVAQKPVSVFKNADLVRCTYANIKYLQAPVNLNVCHSP